MQLTLRLLPSKKMFRVITVAICLALCKLGSASDAADALITVTASLLEEVMSLKDEIKSLELEVQALQSSTCDDTSTSSDGVLIH